MDLAAAGRPLHEVAQRAQQCEELRAHDTRSNPSSRRRASPGSDQAHPNRRAVEQGQPHGNRHAQQHSARDAPWTSACPSAPRSGQSTESHPEGERRGNPQVVLRGAPPVARGHRRGTIPITGSPRRARLSRTSAGFGLTATSASASRAPRHGKLGPRSIRAGAFPPGHEVRAGLAGAQGGLRSRDRDRRRQTPVRSGMAGRCSEAARGP